MELFAGANALAVENTPDFWEVIQFGNAELVSMGRYRLTRLLRGYKCQAASHRRCASD